MKILYLVLSINAFILVQSKTYPEYARQYTVPQNQRLNGNKRYVFVPASTNRYSSNVFEGRQYPWRRTIPLVPQSDSVGGQAPNQVSLLSLIALALNLGNSLFAVPAAQPQRDPASSVAAGVTSGILNYISAQNGGQTSNLNEPVAPNRLGINVPQNDNLNTVTADTAAVSRVRQYRITPFPFSKRDWEWETEIVRRNKIPRRVPLQHMTNLNIFLNRGPHSQQIFNRMKNSQNMQQRDLKHIDISKWVPQRVIVLVPNHHHKYDRPRPSYHYPPPQPSYQPSYKPHKQKHKPSYHTSHPPSYESSYYPSYEPSYHPSHHPSYNYAAPQYDEEDEDDEDDEDDDVTVPVVIEDDDDDDNEYRSSLYELTTELVDVPLDSFGQPVQSDERPTEISMDEDSDEDDETDESVQDQEDIDEEEYKRPESSKEGIKGNELKQINNRLKEKTT